MRKEPTHGAGTSKTRQNVPDVKINAVLRSAYIVVWDDQMGVCAPLGWDDACEGALGTACTTVAVFARSEDAKRAIAISTKFADLCKAQGKPVNEDFLGKYRRNLRVLRLCPAPGSK